MTLEDVRDAYGKAYHLYNNMVIELNRLEEKPPIGPTGVEYIESIPQGLEAIEKLRNRCMGLLESIRTFDAKKQERRLATLNKDIDKMASSIIDWKKGDQNG